MKLILVGAQHVLLNRFAFAKVIVHLHQLVPLTGGNCCSGWSWEQRRAVVNLSLWTVGLHPVPGRGQAERQGVSVSILVLGLEHISEMHKTDLELALELLCLGNVITIRLLLCLNRQKKKPANLDVCWAESAGNRWEQTDFCGSCSRSWIQSKPLSCAQGLSWVTSTACSDSWALRSPWNTHSHLQDALSFWCICSIFVGSDLYVRRAGGHQVLVSFWCWHAGLGGTADVQTRQLLVPGKLAAPAG